MATWAEFAAAAPDLAAWGESRLNRSRVAFLATVTQDGAPRVNPVHPVICEGRLLLFIEPTSPKASDLQKDGRYAIHSLIDNLSGEGGEFTLAGRALSVDDPVTREQAMEASCYTPADEYVLFELSVEAALGRDYEDGKLRETRWQPAYV